MGKNKFDEYIIHRLASIIAKKSGEVNYLNGSELANLFRKLGFKSDGYSFEEGGRWIVDGEVQLISRLKYVTDRLLIINRRKNIEAAISEYLNIVEQPILAQDEINNLFDLYDKSDSTLTTTDESFSDNTRNVEVTENQQNGEKIIKDSVLGQLPTDRPIIFISYSQDSNEHKMWVKKLGDDLSAKGLFVLLDQYNDDGTHLPNFMIKGISKANKVLIIGTENYKNKFDEAKGGASFEDSIISGQLYQDGVEIKKFIPCLRHGTFKTSFPEGFPNYTGYDFTKDEDYDITFDKLYKSLWSKPNSRRPKLGEIPSFVKENKND